MSKTQDSCFFNKTLNWLVCGSMSRSKEEFDDAARQPCRTVIPDPNLYKSGSMSRCGCSKTRPWFRNQQMWDLWTLFSLLGVPKKKCGFVGRASPSIWITAAHCAAPAKIWIQDYNMCELFNFNNRGPWGRIFLVKQTPNRLWTFKNLCPKTCEKDEMYRNV